MIDSSVSEKYINKCYECEAVCIQHIFKRKTKTSDAMNGTNKIASITGRIYVLQYNRCNETKF